VGELETIHQRHPKIAKNEVGAAIANQAREPFLTVGRERDAGAERRQHVVRELTMSSVILNDEYRNAA